MVRTRGATLNCELVNAAYDYAFEVRGVLPLEFDGVIFIDRTQASSRLGLHLRRRDPLAHDLDHPSAEQERALHRPPVRLA